MLNDLLELKKNVEAVAVSAQKVAAGGLGLVDGFIGGLFPSDDASAETAQPAPAAKSAPAKSAPQGRSRSERPDASSLHDDAEVAYTRTPEYDDVVYRKDRDPSDANNLFTIASDGILDGGKIYVRPRKVSSGQERVLSAHMYCYLDSNKPVLIAPDL